MEYNVQTERVVIISQRVHHSVMVQKYFSRFMSARAPYRNAKVAGMSAVYDTEVIVKSVSVADMVARYCKPEVFIESCKACPDYGRVWSCPPGVPLAAEYLA